MVGIASTKFCICNLSRDKTHNTMKLFLTIASALLAKSATADNDNWQYGNGNGLDECKPAGRPCFYDPQACCGHCASRKINDERTIYKCQDGSAGDFIKDDGDVDYITSLSTACPDQFSAVVACYQEDPEVERSCAECIWGGFLAEGTPGCEDLGSRFDASITACAGECKEECADVEADLQECAVTAACDGVAQIA